MYIVVNRTKEIVNLKDLEWILGSKKSIDLDKIRSRKQIDDSSDLKSAVKQGKVQIRHSSVSNTKKDSAYLGPLNPSIKIKTPTLNDEYVERIRVAIRDEIGNQLGKERTPILIPEMGELMAQMKKLLEMQEQGKTVIYEKSDIPQQEMDEEMDIDKLSAIHAKSINKMTKGVVGKVKYTEKQSDVDINRNLDELEGLLEKE